MQCAIPSASCQKNSHISHLHICTDLFDSTSSKNGKDFEPDTDHFDGAGAIWYTLWQYTLCRKKSGPKIKPGTFITDPDIFKTNPASGLRIHGSAIHAAIEIDGLRILTDPVWAVVLLLFRFGPKRFSPRHYHFLFARIGCNIFPWSLWSSRYANDKKTSRQGYSFLLFPRRGTALQKWGIRKENSYWNELGR